MNEYKWYVYDIDYFSFGLLNQIQTALSNGARLYARYSSGGRGIHLKSNIRLSEVGVCTGWLHVQSIRRGTDILFDSPFQWQEIRDIRDMLRQTEHLEVSDSHK